MQSSNWKYVRAPVDEKQISFIEKSTSLELPSDYKSFVSVYNGARPIINALDLENGTEVIFERLLNIESDSKNNIIFNCDIIRKRGQIDLFPFGSDPFGNLFCFKFTAKNTSNIVFWNHESSSTSNICNTFTELLDLFHLASGTED